MNRFPMLTKATGFAGKNLHLSFLFVITFLGSASNIYGQTFPLCGPLPPNSAPSSNLDSILFDRFGNSYSKYNNSSGFQNNSCVAGYFELVNSGLPPDLEPTVCKVFEDLSNLIFLRNNITACGDAAIPSLIRIEVTSSSSGNTLGTGSPFYEILEAPCTQVASNRVFEKINGGSDVTSGFDGKLDINSAPPFPWHTDWTVNPPGNKIDLYSVVLHEAVHILGFASLIGLDGMSNSPGNFFSAWDQYIFTTSNYIPNGNSLDINQVITSNCQSNCWELNTTLFANPIALVSAVVNNCSAAGNLDFIFGNGAIAPLAGGNGVIPGTDNDLANMLSHLNTTCNGQNIPYVMQTMLGPGVPRRNLTQPEIEILCELGYQTSSCNGCYVSANIEFPHPSENVDMFDECCTKDYYTCVGTTITIPHSELLCNDFTNGPGLEITDFYKFSLNGGQYSVVNTGTSFEITPNAQGLFRIFYTVSGCDCKMSNAVFTVLAGPCITCDQVDPCENLTCANGFEDFDPAITSFYSTSFSILYELGGYWVHVGTSQNSPDVCEESSGNKFVQMANREGLALKLQEPIEPNAVATISFRASANNTPNILEFKGSQFGPCHPDDSRINLGCVPTDCGIQIFDPICIGNIPINNLIIHTGNSCPDNAGLIDYSFDWKNQTNVPINYLIITVQVQGVKWVNLDDVTVTKSHVDACFSTSNNCPSVTFTPCDLGLVQGHLWDFGDLSTSTETNPTHTYLENGVYTVTHTVTDVCGNIDVETIAVFISCVFACPCTGTNALNINAGTPSHNPNDPVTLMSISDTEIPNHTVSSIFSPNTLYNGCLAIKGNLIIDNNYDLAILGGQVRMQPGARIIVAAGSKLRLSFINSGSGTERGIHGCEQMWRSIEVQPGGTLVANFNVVQDGEFAFDVKGDLGFISKLSANGNTFDRNHVSVRANGGKISLPFPFAQNKFWATSGLLPQFSNDIANWDANDPYAGLYLNSTSFFVGTESNPGSVNEFDGLRNGILSNRSSLRVYHAKFLNTQGVLAYQEGNPNFNNSQGVGIFAKGGESLVVKNSTFDNAPRAVHTEGTALEFKNNLIQNVDVGLWNKPGQGQVINIYDNDIFFRGRGIYVGSPTTTTTVFIDRNDPIESIPSAITDPVGVTINAGPAASTVIKRIANNQFNLKTINDIGIWLNFSGNWRVQDNRVDYLTPAGNAGTGQGLSLSGSDFNYLRGNQVYGSGTADKAGFRLQNSDNCTLCCNISDDMFSGMQFHGECNPSFLRHNEIRDHNMGLICFNGARIGDQILGGNTWTGSYGFASAVHGGVQDDIQKSEFYIELPRFGSDYWPLDVNSPALPGLWFRPDLSGMTSTDACELTGCPSLPPPPGTPEPPRYPNSDEYLVASGTYGGSGTYSAMSQFEAERNLYRNIRRGIVLTNNAPNLAQFYTNSTSGTIGKFDQVEWRIEDMWKPSPTIQALLDAYQSTISNLSDNINRIDSLYAYAVTFTDTMLLQNQKIGYFAALEQPTQQWQLLMDNVRMTQQGLVPAITTLNNSVPSGDIRVNNRKTLSRIYLETVAVDNFVTTQAQRNDLIAVANQCFLMGGDAVLQARALYAVLVAPLLISDDLLCAGQQRPEADSRNAEQTATRYKASIVPNPAQDQFSVQVEGAAANAMLRVQVVAPNGNIVRDASIQNGQVLSHAFAPGLYICRIYVGEELANVVKLVIIP